MPSNSENKLFQTRFISFAFVKPQREKLKCQVFWSKNLTF